MTNTLIRKRILCTKTVSDASAAPLSTSRCLLPLPHRYLLFSTSSTDVGFPRICFQPPRSFSSTKINSQIEGSICTKNSWKLTTSSIPIWPIDRKASHSPPFTVKDNPQSKFEFPAKNGLWWASAWAYGVKSGNFSYQNIFWVGHVCCHTNDKIVAAIKRSSWVIWRVNCDQIWIRGYASSA